MISIIISLVGFNTEAFEALLYQRLSDYIIYQMQSGCLFSLLFHITSELFVAIFRITMKKSIKDTCQ